ncbi:retrovirus-related pol polyprotein from transposon TNT 1-94, partial [Tanacetum coccineum]
MAKATSSQAWLWHRRLSHLNFDTINLLSKNNIVNGLPKLKFVKDHLCSSCELRKAKRKDGENLDKMKEKGDACIFGRYSTQSKAYKVFNKRTSIIVETIHVNFDELPQMASDHVSSDPVTMSNELELLYSSMFSKLLNETSPVVSKSSVVHAADNPTQREQRNITHSSTTTDVADPSPLNIQSTHHPSAQCWKKDHPLKQVIGNLSQSIRTRRQLETDGEMCMFALTVSQTEPKNIKEAMADSAWIESMQEELHQFNVKTTFQMDVKTITPC